MMTPQLSDFIDVHRREVNAALTQTTSDWYNVQTLEEAVRYALWGGKRLRPLLALMSAYAVDPTADLSCFTEIVCSLEMIHIFTLVHDDLPCMDDAKTRHGQACAHLKFTEGLALLTGDALLNQAFANVYTSPPRSVSGERRFAIAKHLTRACATVVEGQVLDLQFGGKEVSLEELEHLHLCKTAALLEAACLTGAELVGCTDDHRAILIEYSRSIGLAYQVRDDLLSVSGDELVVGKTLASDADADKATYPKLFGVDKSLLFLNELTERAILAVSKLGDSASLLVDFALYQRDRTH